MPPAVSAPPSATPPASGEIDPQLDADGFPTNPAYLAQQGFDPVLANRELVNSQEQLGQISQILSSGDPDLINAFVSEYQRITQQQQQQQQSPLYLPGPGGTPALHVPRSNNDAEYWHHRLLDIHAQGFPPYEKNRQALLQAWSEVPEDAIRHLISLTPDDL